MRALTIALCLLTTPALADVAGPASVIDGDTIEVHGQRGSGAHSERVENFPRAVLPFLKPREG